jgi:glycosyltransferase involved in cell wall biosynthesis
MTPINSSVVTTSVSRLAGGLFTSVRRLHQSVSQIKGVNVRVLAPQDEFTEADLELWKPLRIETFPISRPQHWRYAPELSRAMIRSKADIVHTHGLWMHTSYATSSWHRQTRRPYLISPHGMLDPWAVKNSRWKKQIAWWLFEQKHLRGARCIRALCASEAESIRQLGLTNDIAIIPNGIDLPPGESLTTSTGERSGNPKETAPWRNLVQPGQRVLLFLSRIHPKKGIINLLKAWANDRTKTDWVLAIAGWDQGGHEAELKQLCVERQIPFADVRDPDNNSSRRSSPAVIFLGPQFNESKDACYKHCDAFILPSYSEGLPMVVLEAWANSKPVIMTPECNLPAGFQAGAALKVEATEASLGDGLEALRRMSAAELADMGRRGHDLAAKRFTWSKIASQLQSVHEWILGGGDKPDCIQAI